MRRGSRKELGSRGRPGAALAFLCCACAVALAHGCAHHRAKVEKRLMQGRPEATTPREEYRVGYPDVLQVTVAGRPDLSGAAAIRPDGSLPLAVGGELIVEGRTVEEIARQFAHLAGVPPSAVTVAVTDYRSQPVYLFGQVKGSHRTLAYRGPERVSELLQRVGGITPGAEPADVFVVRAHIADGQRPEVFHVDLRAIVLQNDHSTDLVVQPYDQIHVGETRQSIVERCIPRWLRPLHQMLYNTRPPEKPHKTQLGKRLGDARERRTR